LFDPDKKGTRKSILTLYLFELLIRNTFSHGMSFPAKSTRPTQKHIAKLANVSQATVSVVLSGTPDGSIPASTQRTVLRVAKALGYVPNRAAQTLRTQKTKTIACVVPDITNPFYPALERGAQGSAETHGYDLLIYNTDGTRAKERKCLDQLLQGRVDGIVGIFFHLTAREFLPLFDRQIAVVRVEARPQETGRWPLDNLFVDNVAAARAATDYLLDRGHRKVAMIAGNAGPHSARIQGYCDALKARGLSTSIVSGLEFSEAQGYESTRRLVRRAKPPSAIFAANDIMAIGAIMAARDNGLKVPDDLAIVGFDDIPIARLVSPPLTTVSQFQQKLGRRAVEMILERLQGAVQGPGRCEEARFELLTRQSA
jgi:LacI family transcriptional regulator